MAKGSTTTIIFLYLVVMLSFLLIMAESRFFLGRTVGQTRTQATIECDSVYGVNDGDTCFLVTQMFNLTTPFFGSINPNLNCTALFVGQWLCVDGSTS